MARVICWAGAGLLALVLLLGAAVAGVVSAIVGGGAAGGADCSTDVGGGGPTVAGLTGEQTCNAGIIVHTGQTMRVPHRGLVVAIAVALQESELRNLPGGDRDSVGLFQQRPSQGWGRAEQLRDPTYASRAFYTRLLDVPGWERMPLTEAAQAVQRSAYPDAYARHEQRATAVVNACATGRCAPMPGRWVRPAPGPITSGFRPPDRPTHDGIDIAAPRGATIRAASSGVVITVVCNSSSGSCDTDGAPSVKGCGWYVEVKHAGNVITRYCHMLRRPAVRTGQQVAAGQPIGQVGSSGNSSGPHLHFEVHVRGDLSDRGAIDPAAFLRSKRVK